MTNEDQEREAFEVTDAMMRAAMAQYNAGGNEGGLTKAVIRAALAAQAAPAGAQDGWIDVNDRKPEKNVEVLLAFRDTPLLATGQYTASDQDTWGWCFPKENDPDECGPVTHWQPLPEHPTPKPGWHLAARQQESKALANLRHLYENMIGGAVKDTASARRIATGLLGPAIEQIEREQRESAAAPAEGWDDLPKKLMDAARRDALTDADRVAIGRAIVRIQESAAAPATGDTCHACKGAGGTMTGGVCAECYGQGTYEGARKFIASTQAEPSEVERDAAKRALKAITRTTNDNLAKNTAERALRGMSTVYGEADDSGSEPSEYDSGFDHGYAEATRDAIQQNSGYADAFYELAALMGIGAQPLSPEIVWKEQMLPTLQKALAVKIVPPDALRKANDQAEHFERLWYLRGDQLEALRSALADLVESYHRDQYRSWEKGSPNWYKTVPAAEAALLASAPTPKETPK